MFFNARTLNRLIHMALAVPSLFLAWAFAIYTAYFATSYALGSPPTKDHPSEVAGWFLMFFFGASAIATVIAARVDFLSHPMVRAVFKYSLIIAAVLFLGYSVLSGVSILVASLGGA